MNWALYQHPFSSFCQKAITAFYEKDVDFEPRLLDGSEPVASDFAARWPIARFPVALHGEDLIFEATAIIEHLEALHPAVEGRRLIPADPLQAAQVRMWDRFFDNYVSVPQQRIIYITLGREPDDGRQIALWKSQLDNAYAFADAHLEEREWAASDTFSLADCAAAPALLYAHWTHPIGERFENLMAYRERLLARPSYRRALEEARPYRHLFPLGAPTDRD